MAIRKFNPGRLYKVVRTIVVISSVLAILYGIQDLRLAEYGGSYQQSLENVCPKIFQSPADRADCYARNAITLNSLERTGTVSLLFGIFIPVIFFGGGAIVRYIFPKEK